MGAPVDGRREVGRVAQDGARDGADAGAGGEELQKKRPGRAPARAGAWQLSLGFGVVWTMECRGKLSRAEASAGLGRASLRSVGA